MKGKYLLLLASLFWSLEVEAQIDLALKFPDSLVQNAKELVREERIKIRLNSPSEGTYTYYKKVSMLNNNSTANQIYIGYDAETPISQLKANLYDKNGLLIRKIKREEFEDFAAVDGFSVYQDSRVKRLILNHTDLPCTIEWEYEQKLKGIMLAILPDWDIQEYGTALESGELTIELPISLQLHHRSVNIALKPEISTLKDGFQQYSWKVRHLKAVKEEPYAPHYEQVLPQVQVACNAFQIGDYKGSMSDWKAFGVFKASLYQGRDELPAELKAELSPLLATARNNTEKIERLYRYLQSKMRYVSVQLGIGGWQPFTAEYVYRNKYGDCKALTNFMKAMLNYAQIQAYPALIQSTDEVPRTLDEKFASDPGFNHVILYVPGEKIWLECTSTDFPINYIGESNADRQVLLLTEQGGQLARTPVLGAQENQEHWRAEFHIDAEGSIHNSCQAEFRGANHEVYRSLQEYLSVKERKEWLEKKLNLALIELDSLTLESQPEKAQANLGFKAELSRVGSRSGKRWFLPFNPLAPLSKAPAKLEQRQQRVINRKAYVQELDLSFVLPAGYKLESLPFTEKKLESPFGQFRLQVQAEGNQIHVKRWLQIAAIDLPASEYAAFSNFYQEVAKWDASKMVLLSEEK
jgi:transglutaminase-like putative cysteine protease